MGDNRIYNIPKDTPMGKLQEFDVVFDHPLGVFHAGEILKGAVIMTLSEPMKMRNLRIWFNGRAIVHWTVHKGSGNTRHTVHYKAEEVYIDHTAILFGSVEGDGEMHPAGTHEYKFEVPLPVTLPSSFEGEHGMVRYCCKATIDKPWKFDHETKTAFTVLSHLDLNGEPDVLRAPMRGEDRSEVSCCCWKSGDISAQFSINKKGFVPGEPIIVNAIVNNNSSTQASHSRVSIKQYTEFLGHSDSAYSSGDMSRKVQKHVIAEAERGPILPGDVCKWDNYPMTVPPVPPSRLVGCNIINCTYVVKFYVNVNYGDDVKIACEIIVGTIPLLDTLTTRYGVAYDVPVAAITENGTADVAADTAHTAVDTAKADTEEGEDEIKEPTSPLLPPEPPTYEEYSIKKKIVDDGDTEYTRGRLEYAPHYPFYRQLSIPEKDFNKILKNVNINK